MQWYTRLVIAFVCGGELSFGKLLQPPLLLPLRLFGSPLLDLHVSFALNQVVFALLIRSFAPAPFYRAFWRLVIGRLAHAWRLKSFFFGGRWESDEEGVPLDPQCHAQGREETDWQTIRACPNPDYDRCGRLCRVMGQDDVSDKKRTHLFFGTGVYIFSQKAAHD